MNLAENITIDVNSMDILNIIVYEEEFSKEFGLVPNSYDEEIFKFLLNKIGGIKKCSDCIGLYPWQTEYVELLIENDYNLTKVVPHIAKRIQFFKIGDLVRTLKLIQKGMQIYYMLQNPEDKMFVRSKVINLRGKNNITREEYLKSNIKSEKYNKDINEFRESVIEACKLAPKFNKEFLINKDKDDWCSEKLETMYNMTDFLKTSDDICKLLRKYSFTNIKFPPLCDSSYTLKNEYKLFKYYKNILTYKKEQKILTNEEIEDLIYSSNDFTRKRVKILNKAYGWEFYSIVE